MAAFCSFGWGFWTELRNFLLMCMSSCPQAEVSLVLEHGVPPESIILSSVFKQLAHIKHAAKNNIQHLVCENEAELSKIARLHPNAK